MPRCSARPMAEVDSISRAILSRRATIVASRVERSSSDVLSYHKAASVSASPGATGLRTEELRETPRLRRFHRLPADDAEAYAAGRKIVSKRVGSIRQTLPILLVQVRGDSSLFPSVGDCQAEEERRWERSS